MYPIMIFINPYENTYILYSDVVKQFWSINMNGKNHWAHHLETLVVYTGTKTFSYKCFDSPTQLTYSVIGPDFIRQSIIDSETELSLGNTFVQTAGSIALEIPMEH